MRVLVTGVGGFVGTRLARRLAVAGEEVVGTYLGAEPSAEGVELQAADILDREGLDRIVDGAEPEVVVHLAGFSHVGGSWQRPAEYFQVNVLGVENLLAAAAGRRVILASSAEVYGRVQEQDQPIGEEALVAPRNPYALTKAAAERLVLAAGGVIVRMFNVVGPGQDEGFALPSFARQLASAASGGPRVVRVGNLSARRDFLHIDDAVGGYETLLRDGEPGAVYNLGGGEAVSIRQALDLLIDIAGVDVTVEVDRDRLRPADIELTWSDNRKLRALGWQPRKNLRQALEELWVEVGGASRRSAS